MSHIGVPVAHVKLLSHIIMKGLSVFVDYVLIGYGERFMPASSGNCSMGENKNKKQTKCRFSLKFQLKGTYFN